MSRLSRMRAIVILALAGIVCGCSGINQKVDRTASICTFKGHGSEKTFLARSASGLVIVWYDDPATSSSVIDSVGFLTPARP